MFLMPAAAMDNFQQHALFAKFMIFENALLLTDYFQMDRKEAFGLAWAGIDPQNMDALFPENQVIKYADGHTETITKAEASDIIANHMRFNKENGLGTPLDCDK